MKPEKGARSARGAGSSLKTRALRLLAQREQSRAELRRKLMRHAANKADDAADDKAYSRADDRAYSRADDRAVDEAPAGGEADVEALLDWLETQGLLSNERFVESRVRARSTRFGNLRIRQELAQHGLEPDAGFASELNRTEVERARALRERRFGDASADWTLQLRQMRFLAARGFSAAAIRAATRPGEADEAEADADNNC